MISKACYTQRYPEPKDGEIVLEKPFSEVTARIIDHEVRKLVFEAYNRTEALLKEKRDGLEQVAKRLLSKEILQREDLKELLGPRQYKEQTTFEQLGGVAD